MIASRGRRKHRINNGILIDANDIDSKYIQSKKTIYIKRIINERQIIPYDLFRSIQEFIPIKRQKYLVDYLINKLKIDTAKYFNPNKIVRNLDEIFCDNPFEATKIIKKEISKIAVDTEIQDCSISNKLDDIARYFKLENIEKELIFILYLYKIDSNFEEYFSSLSRGQHNSNNRFMTFGYRKILSCCL